MRVAFALFTVAAVVDGSYTANSARSHRESVVERVVAHDNRTAGGTLSGGVLTLRLEARVAEWHPDADSAPGAEVPAFAEEGMAPRIPGPLIRVPAGTEVSLSLRNKLLGDTLVVSGLSSRTGALSAVPPEPMTLAPGESRTVRFRLNAPGTYYYWGTTTGRDFKYRTLKDAQLSGAIVVDPPGAVVNDRIMVITVWSDTIARAYINRKRLLAVVNGRSWPNTERLHYSVGDTARWRIINASTDAHPMHLHGFYFRVDSRGDGMVDTLYAPDDRPRGFTEMLSVGGTYVSTWVPERPGNWLFHCHIAEHFAARGSLGMPRSADAADSHHAGNHALEGMGGLVMGIVVDQSRAGVAPGAVPQGNETRRRLQLVVRRNAGGSEATPFFGFALTQGGAPPPVDTGLHFGPPLVLTRGEPVSIMVVNTLSEPTSVHWHGIELESYFDGVAGFSGDARRTSPSIAPGDSFEARFTPPRSGTFIYHTHTEEERQLLGGLAGALIVLQPGEKYDPSADHVVLITSPTSFAEQQRAVLVGGSPTPAPLLMRSGVRQRLRFINMTVRRPVLRVDLMRDSVAVDWSVIAKDALDFPQPIRSPSARRRNIGLGETLDFSVTPDVPGDLRLDVRIGGQRPPYTLMGSMPIHVVP
jgi:FtsP/CotA-like multicopper oxidase with cupredoxin domain